MKFAKFNLDKFLKELQTNPLYWVASAVVLLLFLRLSSSFFLNNVVSFVVITCLLNIAFNDWNKSLIYSAVIMVVVNVIHTVGNREGFDNPSEILKQLSTLKLTSTDDLKKESKDPPLVEMNGKKHTLQEYDQMSDKEKDKVYRGLEEADKGDKEKAPKRPAARAQRELFQLIDTVDQLRTTVEELGPVLKEGHKIMDAFDHLKV